MHAIKDDGGGEVIVVNNQGKVHTQLSDNMQFPSNSVCLTESCSSANPLITRFKVGAVPATVLRLAHGPDVHADADIVRIFDREVCVVAQQ